MGLTINLRALCSLAGAMKIVQIVLGFIAIALFRSYDLHFSQGSSTFSSNEYRDRQMTGEVAICCGLLISITLLIGYVFFEAASNLVESLFCVTAAIMNIAGGALAIEVYKDRTDTETNKAGLAMGAMMLINALVYLADSVIGTIRVTK